MTTKLRVPKTFIHMDDLIGYHEGNLYKYKVTHVHVMICHSEYPSSCITVSFFNYTENRDTFTLKTTSDPRTEVNTKGTTFRVNEYL